MLQKIKGLFQHQSFLTGKMDYFILGAPLLSLILFKFFEQIANIGMNKTAPISFLVLILTHMHLMASVVRAYGQNEIYQSYKKKLLVIPPILILITLFSGPYYSLLLFITLLLDSLHTANQVYVLGRLYDNKVNSDRTKGRKLDFMMAMVIHFTPLFIFASEAKHLKEMLEVGSTSAFSLTNSLTSYLILGLGYIKTIMPFFLLGFIALYLNRYQVLVKKGYKISSYKIILFAITLLVNLYIWSQGNMVMALLAINFSHALQYIILISHTEKKQLSEKFKTSPLVSSTLFLIVLGIYALIIADSSNIYVVKFSLAVALIHYWLDTFIWKSKGGS